MSFVNIFLIFWVFLAFSPKSALIFGLNKHKYLGKIVISVSYYVKFHYVNKKTVLLITVFRYCFVL